MANPAALSDLENRWRPLSTQEQTNGQTFLDDAWRMLRRRVTNLETNIATDTDLHDEAVRVIAQAVLRVMKNPDGKRQESIDDYAWTRDQAVSAGLLYFTDQEINDLIPGEDTRRGAWDFDLLGINGLGDATDYPDARFQ
ncbi:MAG TPA: Gp19/Gp15/Gp42 family protein [Nocardioidaceae bacterium]|nr:Gp19/Gp15/Gp42 family protein [Nocardioidaceae bacterium]